MVVSQKKIVVIEDEPDAAEMFTEMMRVSGFHALKCHASETAIQMTPEVSGPEVLKFMGAVLQLAQIPESYPSDSKTGMDAGASAYLTKPDRFPDLQQAARKAMAPGRLSTPSL